MFDLVYSLIVYHLDRIKPSAVLTHAEVQDLADLYHVSTQEVLDAMDEAQCYLDLDEVSRA